MNLPENDKTVLESRILHEAHIIDKTLAASPGMRDYLLKKHGPILERFLKDRDERGYPTNSCTSWARDILEQLKARREPQMASERCSWSGDVMALLRSRRSVRNWTADPVGDELLQNLFEAARWAPSSGNRQSVRLVVLRSEVVREPVLRLREAYLRRAPVVILVGVDLRVYKPEERRELPFLDAAAAIENMLLAAHALGLGFVWTKFCIEDWESRPDVYFEIKKRLNLPNSFRPVSVIAGGWPAKVTRPPGRREVEEFVRYEDEGFPPDDYPQWRPDYWRLYWSRFRRRVGVVIRSFLHRWAR